MNASVEESDIFLDAGPEINSTKEMWKAIIWQRTMKLFLLSHHA